MRNLLMLLVLTLVSESAWSRGNLNNLQVHRKIRAMSAELVTISEARKALSNIVRNHKNNPNNITLVSSTDASVSSNINSVVNRNSRQALNNLSRIVYFDFPYEQVKNRASRTVNDQFGHLSDRYNALIFTFMIGNSLITNIVFSSDIQAYVSSIIIGANALATALVTLHPTNYSKILQLGKKVFGQNRFIKRLSNNKQEFVSSVTTSTVYNLLYAGALQTVLNWNNLENLLSTDVITGVLASVGITVTASTAWQETLNSLKASGRLSENAHDKLSGGRTMIMVLLGTLINIGVPNTAYGTLVFALAGVQTYILESNRDKIESVIRRLKTLKKDFKGDRFFKNPFKRKRSHYSTRQSSAGSCRAILGY